MYVICKHVCICMSVYVYVYMYVCMYSRVADVCNACNTTRLKSKAWHRPNSDLCKQEKYCRPPPRVETVQVGLLLLLPLVCALRE